MTDFNFDESNRYAEGVNQERNLIYTGSRFGSGFNAVDWLSLESSLGPRKSIVTATYHGIDNNGYLPGAPINQDQQGLSFFTRPRMRLATESCLSHDSLQPMLITENRSMHRAVRAILDPIGSGSPQRITATRNYLNDHLYPSDLIDPYTPFIPLLGNMIVSMSGWPDIDIGKYVSREGVQKETWSMIDGVADIYSNFTLNVSLRNLIGDPIGYLFWAWLVNASQGYQGENTPWMDSIIDHEIDYQTRIYRLILDPTRTYVQKMAYTGVAMPVVANVGAGFNYSEKPYNEELNDHQVSFDCNGAVYYTVGMSDVFNRHVTDFNISMLDGVRERNMTKITIAERKRFRFSGYPRINPNDSELEWWVFNEHYRAMNRNLHGRF